jgi:hypothetical protein
MERFGTSRRERKAMAAPPPHRRDPPQERFFRLEQISAGEAGRPFSIEEGAIEGQRRKFG